MLSQTRAMQWRQQLLGVYPAMPDDVVAAQVEQLWFAQVLTYADVC
jgi:hypothetical protein